MLNRELNFQKRLAQSGQIYTKDTWHKKVVNFSSANGQFTYNWQQSKPIIHYKMWKAMAEKYIVFFQLCLFSF